MHSYESWFRQVTGFRAHDWQALLAASHVCTDRLIRIPTGLGKTEGVLGAWLWNAVGQGRSDWPRRLVWCLPMRVLVEQTASRARALIDGWAGMAEQSDKPRVHVLMGGEDAERWYLEPTSHAVLVGTQDMLLSRALNRGYASGRARWPMEYGLLNQDSLWVMDEVQLMDVGLATSAQLQAFRDQDRSKQLRPCYTWWMSATLQPEWLDTVDFHTQLGHLSDAVIRADPASRQGGLWEIRKPLSTVAIPEKEKDTKRLGIWADTILETHHGAQLQDTGRVTLVTVNRVEEAQAIHGALSKKLSGEQNAPQLELIHSRFRGLERRGWTERFLSRPNCENSQTNLILVSTQVVEAGVDISATALITELAPWPSLVQRFGRAARYRGTAQIIVVDPFPDEKSAKPYELADLAAAREAIQKLNDASVASIEDFEADLADDDLLARLYRYDYIHLVTRREFDELYDTSPDLSGTDLDISRFIRSGEERDVHVCWIDSHTIGDDRTAPSPDLQPVRDGLCPVPVYRAQKWLFEKGQLKDKCRAWAWEYLDGEWKSLRLQMCYPGQVLVVDAEWGGYDLSRGFTGNKRKTREPPVPTDGGYRTQADADFGDDAQPREDRSRQDRFKTIATHGREVAHVVEELATALGLDDRLKGILKLAALWHDWGKAHPAFQFNIVLEEGAPPRNDFAKAPEWVDYRAKSYGWPERCREGTPAFHKRFGFRHELASTTALFELLARTDRYHDALLGPYRELVELGVLTPPDNSQTLTDHRLSDVVRKLPAMDFNLLACLMCCHHGKVRGQWQASPHDQEFPANDSKFVGNGSPVQGLRDGDPLPGVGLFLPDGGCVTVPDLELHLDLSAAGLSSGYGMAWTDRVLSLLEEFGPTTLAFLEALLRIADACGSELTTEDIRLQEETEV